MDVKVQIPKELLDEMEKAKPSADPAYWAKPSCTTCLGRGKLGKIRTVIPGGGNNIIEQDESLCPCARKRYKKWQDEWLAAHQPAPGKKSGNGNGTLKAQPPVARTMERLDRLDDMLGEMRAEAHQLASFIEALPQKEQLARIEAQQSFHTITIENCRECAEALDKGAEEKREQAKLLNYQATNMESESRRIRQEEITSHQKSLGELRVEHDKVRKEYHHQAHQWGRKFRILEAKIQKMSRRRDRVAQDGGVVESQAPAQDAPVPEVQPDQ